FLQFRTKLTSRRNSSLRQNSARYFQIQRGIFDRQGRASSLSICGGAFYPAASKSGCPCYCWSKFSTAFSIGKVVLQACRFAVGLSTLPFLGVGRF
ncbi:hypothetical protein, partial [Saccharophagus sp. K07]|uniref:hypothetical protein n=1 Tax=Saccharophagus sp. K07 TaxID=2283636 RepID=UPI001CA332F8